MKLTCILAIGLVGQLAFAANIYDELKSRFEAGHAFDPKTESDNSFKAGRCFSSDEPKSAMASALYFKDSEPIEGPLAGSSQRQVASIWSNGNADYFDSFTFAQLFDFARPKVVLHEYKLDVSENAFIARFDGYTARLRTDGTYIFSKLTRKSGSSFFCYYYKLIR